MSDAKSLAAPLELLSLPPEILGVVCEHLADSAPSEGQQSSLLRIVSVCKVLREIALPLAWRQLSVTFDEPDKYAHSTLKKLESMASSSTHSVWLYIKEFRFFMSYYLFRTNRCAVKRLDTAVANLLGKAAKIAHAHIDFSMIDEAPSHFPQTMHHLFASTITISSMNIQGLVSSRQIHLTEQPQLTSLTLMQISPSLILDLSQFTALRYLNLGICCDEVVDTEGDISTYPAFPSSLWRTLEIFVLSLYGDGDLACGLIISSIIGSLKCMETIKLRQLGIKWHVDEDFPRGLLSAFKVAAPGVKSLALVVSDLPSLDLFRGIALDWPYLTELTVCAHAESGAWTWTESATEYATALAAFEHLQRLAINHCPASKSEIENDTITSAKFSFECSEESAELKKAFAHDIVQKCGALREIVFLPFQQDKARLVVAEGDDSAAELRFVAEVPTSFWHSQ